MAQNILMPALSPTMTEGKLSRWLKAEGDRIAPGEVIAEIETDKATMEFEAADAGTLGKIVVPAGTEGVLVNALIGILLEEGDDASALAPAPAPTPAPALTAVAAPVAAAVTASAPAPAPVVAQTPVEAHGSRVFASPLARRVAKAAGINIASLQGTGPHGRIIKADVEAAKATGGVKAVAAVALAPPTSPTPTSPTSTTSPVAAAKPAAGLQPMPWQKTTAFPNSGVRKVIARRLSEAKQTVPHFYLTIDLELDALMALRGQLNARPNADYKLSVNDFIVKAVGVALRKVPAANAMWTDEAILRFDTIDVSVAVATDGGLMTPVVKDADSKSLSAISNEVKALAKKARDGKLKPEEFQGGGFTISNLGMYGIREFSAIINPPQSAILAVGAGEERAVVRKGEIVIRTIASVTLSVDHRSVDGAIGAEFLAAFKPLIEDPLSLLV